MRDDRKRHPRDTPIETEGMGGAGGGDIDDLGDVGDPEDHQSSGTRLDSPDGDLEVDHEMRGDDLDMLPATMTDGSSAWPVAGGDTGTVTGITTGVDTDDATEGPGSLWDHIDNGPPLSDERDGGPDS